MEAASHLIRRRRLGAGLTLRQLASRAGTSAPTLNRYESGAIDPTIGTLNRILHSCTPTVRRWASLDELAPAFAQTLADAGSLSAWRLVGELLDDVNHISTPELGLLLSDSPQATGDERVDALMAALAEHLSVINGLLPPSWTQIPMEVTPWWFVSGKLMRALALLESPVSFARRGIFITAGALARV